jgi:hypothetical protein
VKVAEPPEATVWVAAGWVEITGTVFVGTTTAACTTNVSSGLVAEPRLFDATTE